MLDELNEETESFQIDCESDNDCKSTNTNLKCSENNICTHDKLEITEKCERDDDCYSGYCKESKHKKTGETVKYCRKKFKL